MAQEKEYFAFISYQRKDEEWADRLRSKLEHYRLPSSVRKQDASLPKEIRPIFRDALELAGGVLAKEIETALQNSKFLIVICSPNSAKSPWVNKEIQTFIDLGREDKIIPFIIDGTPFSDNEETECFPPALRSLIGEKELLGININELSRDAASIKVVARMFGLKFDTLWQRYEREKKRKRWTIIGGALLFALVSLGIGTYIAHQNRELDARNKEIIAERDRANSERDRAESANASLLLANDSIQRQFVFIEKQNDVIDIERNKVDSTNHKMLVNLSRFLSEETLGLLADGDSYLARLLILEALPPNNPYTLEAEEALRKISECNTAILRGHIGGVNYACFSPDGKRIVSVSKDKTIRVWDAYTGSQIGKPFVGHSGSVESVGFSPNGKYVVSSSDDKTIRIWDVKTGAQIGKPLVGHTGRVNSVCFSPDGQNIVSASDDKTVRIWETKTGKQIGDTSFRHNDCVNFVCFSPDGGKIASVSKDNKIKVWGKARYTEDNTKWVLEYQTNRPYGSLFQRSGKFDCPNSIFFSSNCTDFVVADNRDSVHIMKMKDKSYKSVKFKKGIEGRFAALSPNGLLIVSVIKDRIIGIWDTQTGQQLERFIAGNEGKVNSVLFSPDGKRVVSASNDGTVRIWDVIKKKQDHSSHSLQQLIDEIRDRFKNRQLTPEERRKYYLE